MTKRVSLSKKGFFSVIDDDDFEKISKFKWHLNNGYAQAKKGKAHYYMHRIIAKTPSNMICDHINRNKLDNRKENLRNVTAKENSKNLSPYKLKPKVKINLKKWRESAGFTQESLAFSLRIATRTITRWEANGKIKEIYIPVLIGILGEYKND